MDAPHCRRRRNPSDQRRWFRGGNLRVMVPLRGRALVRRAGERKHYDSDRGRAEDLYAYSRCDWEYEFEIQMGEAVVGRELALKTRDGKSMEFRYRWATRTTLFSSRSSWKTGTPRGEIQRSPHFPQGVNVEFVIVDSKHDLRARFFERGVGETQSSGTGSCASAAAAMASGRAETPIKVHAPGGTQTVRREGNSILLRGPARLVCRGEFFLS